MIQKIIGFNIRRLIIAHLTFVSFFRPGFCEIRNATVSTVGISCNLFTPRQSESNA